MIIRVLPEAHRELRDAVAYYERQQAGLGARLWGEVDDIVLWIQSHPEVAQLRAGGYRRVNLRVFPYFIAYSIRGAVIWVLAIGHTHRRPDYWGERNKRAGS